MYPSREYLVSLQKRIEHAYNSSGNKLGWRFLASPCAVLTGAEVAFIGLIPGGQAEQKDHAQLCMSAGSAYSVESWAGCAPGRSPLQQQVLGLFDHLNVQPEKVLAGNLVPFRSRDWDTLRNKQYSIEFGEQLWREVFNTSNPKLVVTMGKDVFLSVADIFGARREQWQSHDVCWQGRKKLPCA